jgi:hypothetical protein
MVVEGSDLWYKTSALIIFTFLVLQRSCCENIVSFVPTTRFSLNAIFHSLSPPLPVLHTQAASTGQAPPRCFCGHSNKPRSPNSSSFLIDNTLPGTPPLFSSILIELAFCGSILFSYIYHRFFLPVSITLHDLIIDSFYFFS